MLLLALLANPRFTRIQVHRRIDDRFDLSDLEGQAGERSFESSAMRASMRSRSAAVTERLPVRAGAE